MINKIIHIADLHIRTTQYHDVYLTQFNKLYDKLDELNLTFDETRVVIAGDIFHQKINISNEQLIIASNLLTKLSKYGKVVLIPGNHDFLENNIQRLDSITPVVDLLNNDKITYHKNGGVYGDENISWVVYSLYQHNEKPNFIKEDGKFYVGLFHGPIQGLSTDTGYEFDDAYDKINFYDLDLLLCGDIHKRQQFDLPNHRKAIMVGSLIQQNFGETVNHHGFGLYDIKMDKYKFYDLENETPFLNFEITDIKDITDDKERLLNFG